MTLHVEEAGAGSPLVLLHGWGFHSGIWNGFADALAKRHRVHLVDLPGHGRSRDVPLGSIDALADALSPHVPADSIVCGWSLGGLAAQRIAVRHPERVRALALLGSTPSFVSRAAWAHGVDLSTLALFAGDLAKAPEATLHRFLSLNTLGSNAARTQVREIAARLAACPWPRRDTLDAGLALLRDTDLRDDAGHVASPTVVVHGVRDRIVPVGAGRWLGASIPHAAYVELPDSAHLPFVTDSARVLEAIGQLDG